MTNALLCEGKHARILKTDAAYLIEKYSKFAGSDDLKKYICLAFCPFSSDEHQQKKQELRDSFGIGTGNELRRRKKNGLLGIRLPAKQHIFRAVQAPQQRT